MQVVLRKSIEMTIRFNRERYKRKYRTAGITLMLIHEKMKEVRSYIGLDVS